jgi:3'-phosphoadenosine 5'-phosphosulfate (PAPS) 3'-phosphatase
MDTLQHHNIPERYQFMMSSVRELGALVLALVKERQITDSTKPDSSKVTSADVALNERFIELVEGTYPDDLVWGEELSNSQKGNVAEANENWMWLIDPIDGTSGFWRSYENKRFKENSSTIMVTGFAPGETTPTMSVIHNPFQDQQVTISADTDNTYYHTSTAHRLGAEPKVVRLTEQGPTRLEDVQRFEQSNWKDCVPNLGYMRRHVPYARVTDHQIFMVSVALGDVQLSAFPGPSNPHDVAPGALIVHNAGGAVTTFKNEKYDEVDWRLYPISGTVCAPNQELAEEFVARFSHTETVY